MECARPQAAATSGLIHRVFSYFAASIAPSGAATSSAKCSASSSKSFDLLPQLIDGGGQLIDAFEALVQQQFEAADLALFVFQFAAQAADGGAQYIIFLL